MLPGLEFNPGGDDPADAYMMVLERKPTDWELETAGHFATCSRIDGAYVFIGAPGNPEGLSCYVMGNKTHAYNVEFAQCPFCGAVCIGHFIDEEGNISWSAHPCCLAECDFARSFNIDSGFMDFTTSKGLPLPTKSPMLLLARHAAERVRFDSVESLAELQGFRQAAQVLRSARIFAAPDLMQTITKHAADLSAEEHCPRYRELDYAVHARHRASGTHTPCPCRRCEAKQPVVPSSDLEGMKAPKLKM